MRTDVHDWLMAGDPAIRWQVLRDLADAPAERVATERARVAREGWGAELLARQGADGSWGRSDARRFVDAPDGATLHALHLLLDFGLDPACAEARRALGRVRERVTHYHAGERFFDGEVEACINGRLVAIAAGFGEPDDGIVDRLLSEQLGDGGWNCEAPPSTRASFHSTICVLEGLLAAERAWGPRAGLRAARERGEAYLLERGLLRSRSTGRVPDPMWARLAYPCGYHYDVLRALDHLRAAGTAPDERVAEALAIVEGARRADGRWNLGLAHPDVLAFDLGEREGEPSRWVTLRALRVLRWAGRGA